VKDEFSQRTRLTVGRVSIDREKFEVRQQGRPVRLTRKEFDLLWALASKPGMVFPRRDLLMLLWGDGVSVDPRTIDAHMTKLRKKLGLEPTSSPNIETVWGIGYRLRRLPS
jgi:DNA-binding response OmpR family regulator